VIELSEQTIINHVVERLTAKHPAVPPETIAAIVASIHARFDGRPVRDYVALLVERHAATALTQLSA
jgi:hypothetical protein